MLDLQELTGRESAGVHILFVELSRYWASKQKVASEVAQLVCDRSNALDRFARVLFIGHVAQVARCPRR